MGSQKYLRTCTVQQEFQWMRIMEAQWATKVSPWLGTDVGFPSADSMPAILVATSRSSLWKDMVRNYIAS